MQAGKLNKRVELQFKHIQDMIKEQNRMVLAEVEPTDSEREDMLILLSEIKNNTEKGPRSSAIASLEKYNSILGELSELGYNTSPFSLVIGDDQQPSASGTPENDDNNRKVRKQVHFEVQDDDENQPIDESGLPFSGSSTGSNPSNIADQFSATQVYDQNELLMDYQDRRLYEIGNSVGRQRTMGESINTELGVHNNLLEDVEAQVDHSQSRLDRLTNGVKTFNRKSRECGVCSIIIGLVLLLFIVILI